MRLVITCVIIFKLRKVNLYRNMCNTEIDYIKFDTEID
jgi:hypothetical protein